MRLVVILTLLTQCLGINDRMKEMRKAGVYLSVSSVSSLFTYGQFEVNWYGIPAEYFGKTYIALMTNTTSEWKSLDMWPVTKANGKKITNVDAPAFDLDVLMKGQCLGYAAGFLTRLGNQYKILLSSCFSARPTWMRRYCSEFSRLTLREMLIPGTHNSGMYNLGYAHPHEKLYLYNQDQTIRQQLAYGIRGFDLRVQYYNGQFYVTHDTVRGWITIREVLQDVRWFVNVTGEVVLLDFHRFTTGFGKTNENERHMELWKLIVKELKDLLLEKAAWWKPVGDIFGDCTNGEVKNGRIIVFYNHDFNSTTYDKYLAMPVKQMWPNAHHPDVLKTYLEKEACAPQSSQMIGIMAELTASFPNFILGNRVGAEWVNYMVTEFFRRNYDRCRGIIYTDFFLGSGVIEVAVEANFVIACQSGGWKSKDCKYYLNKKLIPK
uniref:Phosphatidylinositol-specific phospholipase C X domain-containing protein n=1 Tax=Amblyomma maculatum TaxID=34609 RepID=G3ML16_AMBMU